MFIIDCLEHFLKNVYKMYIKNVLYVLLAGY